MTEDILYRCSCEEWSCHCAHASTHDPQKGWCCSAYYMNGELVSCKEAFGTPLCKLAAHNYKHYQVSFPEMIFPEGDPEYTYHTHEFTVSIVEKICNKLGYKMVKNHEIT